MASKYLDKVRLSQRAIGMTGNVKLKMSNECVGELIPGER